MNGHFSAVNRMMDHPFPKSISYSEKYKKLLEIIGPEDTLAVLINADPDAMASALALQRLFGHRLKKTLIYHVNVIKRADNLAMIRLLQIEQQHIRKLNRAEITKWAIVDSQPDHHELFGKYAFDIIIDHHPLSKALTAPFMDINEEYGANSTIMTEYLKAAHIRPSPQLATALFYGIKTDTDDFVRSSTQNDINAFQYLYPFTNIHIVKKIESSEITKETLASFHMALENLVFIKDKTFIHMGEVASGDILVILADFFLKIAESRWCIVSGIYGRRLIVIFRSAGFRLDAGKMAQKLFGKWGSAGGHIHAARAEVLLDEILPGMKDLSEVKQFMIAKLKGY
jgi:nanoRNase/pAp phosphatase (c-di-AMP/oligoRNAs hydrolase)